MTKKRRSNPEVPSADPSPSGVVFPSLRSLAPRLLLQPTRLKRNNKPINPQPSDPRPKVIETDREALTNIRRAWHDRAYLVRLTVEELRTHLAQECRALPLEAVCMDRGALLRLGREAPPDPHFWGAVHQALAVVWPPSVFRNATEQPQFWDGRFFRETFDCTQYPAREQWVQTACALVAYMFLMKSVAQLHIAERSRLLCLAHEARKAKADHKASKTLQTEGRPKATYKYGVLIAAAQEWLPTKWVQKEIAALRRQLLSDSESDRQEAQEILDEIAKVQVAFGSGPAKQGTAQERKLRRQESLHASGTKRSVPQIVQRLVEKVKKQYDRLLAMKKVQWKPGEAWQEAYNMVWIGWEKRKKTEQVKEVREEFVKEIKGLEPKR